MQSERDRYKYIISNKFYLDTDDCKNHPLKLDRYTNGLYRKSTGQVVSVDPVSGTLCYHLLN